MLQLKEPAPKVAAGYAIGIDLGTTNSLVSYIDNDDKIQLLADELGNNLFPSVVHFLADGSNVVGNFNGEALLSISSIKRLLAKDLTEIAKIDKYQNSYEFSATDLPEIKTPQGDKSATEISSIILQKLYKLAIKQVPGEIKGAVLTVPAYFDDAQRQATKDAAELAGIKVLRLLNEPTAAAIAYGLDKQASGFHLVYDLGGGTFDVSILKLEQGLFKVIAIAGDSNLGGDDIDVALLNWLLNSLKVTFEQLSKQAVHTLKVELIKAKIALSVHSKVNLNLEFLHKSIELTREKFEAIIEPIIKRTIKLSYAAMLDAGLEPEQLKDIILVGGSAKIPYIKRRLHEVFGLEPLFGLDPDKIVAMGAGIQANALIGKNKQQKLLLLDVVPLSLGIETVGGLAEKIIHRNATTPVSHTQTFTTSKDKQTHLELHVVQGELDLVKELRSLARFKLKLPQAKAGQLRITVTFTVDTDGILSVNAKELTTGETASVEVKPTYGLDKEKLQKILAGSLDKMEQDKLTKNYLQAKYNAENLLNIINNTLTKDKDNPALLSAEEYVNITNLVDSLTKLLQEANKQETQEFTKQLQTASDKLEATALPYIQRKVGNEIKTILAR